MGLVTRELSLRTWPDFLRLFAPGTGWAFCACMLYQRGCHLPRSSYPTREAMRVENMHEKQRLVEIGRAHGVLVYDGESPVGWCQYGRPSELPLPGASQLDKRIAPREPDVDWRITCFVTARSHRRTGVASTALRAAIASISSVGGGLVEAYPTTTPENGNRQHSGTVAMFEREGFEVSRRPSTPYVVVRRRLHRSA